MTKTMVGLLAAWAWWGLRCPCLWCRRGASETPTIAAPGGYASWFIGQIKQAKKLGIYYIILTILLCGSGDIPIIPIIPTYIGYIGIFMYYNYYLFYPNDIGKWLILFHYYPNYPN